MDYVTKISTKHEYCALSYLVKQ